MICIYAKPWHQLTRGVLGGICWYMPYTNLWCFLTAYAYLICHNKTAYTGIYWHLISSVYSPLFLAIHHCIQLFCMIILGVIEESVNSQECWRARWRWAIKETGISTLQPSLIFALNPDYLQIFDYCFLQAASFTMYQPTTLLSQYFTVFCTLYRCTTWLPLRLIGRSKSLGQIPKQGSPQIWIKLTLTYSQMIV